MCCLNPVGWQQWYNIHGPFNSDSCLVCNFGLKKTYLDVLKSLSLVLIQLQILPFGMVINTLFFPIPKLKCVMLHRLFRLSQHCFVFLIEKCIFHCIFNAICLSYTFLQIVLVTYMQSASRTSSARRSRTEKHSFGVLKRREGWIREGKNLFRSFSAKVDFPGKKTPWN